MVVYSLYIYVAVDPLDIYMYTVCILCFVFLYMSMYFKICVGVWVRNGMCILFIIFLVFE